VIREPRTDADFERCVGIKNAVDPDEPVTVDELRQTRGGTLLLHEGGGYVFVARSSVADSAYVMVRVAPEARRRGIGSALLDAAREHARSLEVSSVWGRVAPHDEESLRFVLGRGFAEAGREVELVRALAPDEGPIPEGIAELADEHRAGAYAVAVECTPDMPTAGAAVARPYDEWAAEELSGPVAFVALGGDRVIGYATLRELQATPHRLEHGLTAVLRSHRGRGLAQKLKRAQISWAAAHGYLELVTTTGETNEAMRAVNLKLGYLERPSAVLVRGDVS
jgi:GNAT superfamily N-acetyltransferase